MAIAPLLLWSCNSITGASKLTVSEKIEASSPDPEDEGFDDDDDDDNEGPGSGDEGGGGSGQGGNEGGGDRLVCDETSDGAAACVQCCLGDPRDDLAQRYFRNCFCGPFDDLGGFGIVGFCQECAQLCQTVGPIVSADFARCLACGRTFNVLHCDSLETLCRAEEGGAKCDKLDDCVDTCD